MPTTQQPEHRTIAKFHITKSQYFLGAISLLAILGLGASTIISSSTTVKRAQILSNVESPAASIIFTQRETLVYATRLAQWANGGTERRTVQIARNILAQRLAVIDTSGKSMGSRAQADYWKVLKQSDAIVASAPMGILPENLHPKYNELISPITDEILAEARRLVVSYQKSVDREMISVAKESADRNRINLIFFYIFLIFGGLFLYLNARTNFKNYRLARETLNEEQERLDLALAELQRTQSTVAELQDLNASKNAFISTVNHELRTPLTSIIGYLDVIRDEELEKPESNLTQYLDVLERNAQILLHLVESMLTLSKIDAASGKLSEAKVSLNEVIDNSIFIMRPPLEKSEIAISFSAEAELFVQGDTGQLNQIFINLLGNAIKFSASRSSIEITLTTTVKASGREYAQISIRDHGIGIPADDIEHLFTRFFRAKNADSGQYPGTGLGLSIVHQVVTRHGGSISVDSELGKGTTFTVELPLYLSPEDRLIIERSADVLSRAIHKLESATPETIAEVTHEIGGAIGFYNFADIGEEILKYSRHVRSGVPTLEQFNLDRARLLELMNQRLNEVPGGRDE
jgi:signal transduction histidine kinase